MENKHGEPWTEITAEDYGSIIYFSNNGKTVDYLDSQSERRVINCVNLLAGIPDEELPNVLKAYVALMIDNNEKSGTIDATLQEVSTGEYFPLTKKDKEILSILDNLKNLSCTSD